MGPRSSVKWLTSLVCWSSGKHPWANTSAHRFRQCGRVLFVQILHHPPEVCHDALRTGQHAGQCPLSHSWSENPKKNKTKKNNCFFFCSLCVAAVVPPQIHTHSQNLYIMSQPLLYGECAQLTAPIVVCRHLENTVIGISTWSASVAVISLYNYMLLTKGSFSYSCAMQPVTVTVSQLTFFHTCY